MARHTLQWLGRIAATAASALLLGACRLSPVEAESTDLEVRAAVSRTTVSASAGPASSRAEVVVSDRNPRWQPVVVQLGGPPYISGNIPAAQTQGIGFGVRLIATDSVLPPGGSEWTWGQPTIRIGPRTTLRHTFVIDAAPTNGRDEGRPPGTYQVIASFGRQEAPPLQLTVVP